MNITVGFEIENPNLFIPWGIDEEGLKNLLGQKLRHVTTGYYTLTCFSLGGLHHELGFHFEPRKSGSLIKLEFYRTSYADQTASYNEFQNHFEAYFGKPTLTENGNEGFQSHQWNLKGVTIVHYVYDRFGPEEHMEIKLRPVNKTIQQIKKRVSSFFN